MRGTPITLDRHWTRPCACGGKVRANPDDPTPGVRTHNDSDEHRLWRGRTEAADRIALELLDIADALETSLQRELVA